MILPQMDLPDHNLIMSDLKKEDSFPQIIPVHQNPGNTHLSFLADPNQEDLRMASRFHQMPKTRVKHCPLILGIILPHTIQGDIKEVHILLHIVPVDLMMVANFPLASMVDTQMDLSHQCTEDLLHSTLDHLVTRECLHSIQGDQGFPMIYHPCCLLVGRRVDLTSAILHGV